MRKQLAFLQTASRIYQHCSFERELYGEVQADLLPDLEAAVLGPDLDAWPFNRVAPEGPRARRASKQFSQEGTQLAKERITGHRISLTS